MSDPSTRHERLLEAASIALASGDHTSAERSLRAAIAFIEGLEGAELELAAALARLGALKHESGSHAEAEGHFLRAVEIGERALGTDHLGLVPALKGLGTTRLVQGNPQNAEPSLTRALAISERHLGDDHPDLVILLNDLTRLYLKQSAHAFAEPLLLRMLELKLDKGEDHPEVATVLASLAVVRQALGRHDSAEHLWRRVLSIRERTLAPNHFSLATALGHLAETCAARGKLEEALGLYQRALTIREATLGRDHTSLRVVRERMADLELQASEETSQLEAPRPAKSGQGRRISDESLGLALASVSRSTPPGIPLSSERAFSSKPLEHFVAPTAGGLAMTAVKATPTTGSYLDVLNDIKHELGPDVSGMDALAPMETSQGVMATVAMFVRRRRVATAVGISVITLPLAFWGVAGATRSGEPKWVENVAAARPAAAAAVAGPVTLADLTIGPGDSAARAAASKYDKGEKGEKGETQNLVRMPAAPNVVVRLDSVRGVGAPFAPSGESVLRHLASSANIQSDAAAGAPVRARMIGALPTPRYPAQQIRGGAGGEVRVRFDVDTNGRPVMSTFTVVGTPLPQLAKAVKDVIPKIRFEPARTPWPENKPVIETVELAFQFAVQQNKN